MRTTNDYSVRLIAFTLMAQGNVYAPYHTMRVRDTLGDIRRRTITHSNYAALILIILNFWAPIPPTAHPPIPPDIQFPLPVCPLAYNPSNKPQE